MKRKIYVELKTMKNNSKKTLKLKKKNLIMYNLCLIFFKYFFDYGCNILFFRGQFKIILYTIFI